MEDPKLVKPRELIQLLPNDKLCFQNSEKEDITYLTLLNSTSLKVAYKIKTTSPYDFKVCPSKGIICAYSNVKVRIILLPIPNIHKKRHKFLIQAKYTTYSELSKIEWNDQNVEVHKLKAVINKYSNEELSTDLEESHGASRSETLYTDPEKIEIPDIKFPILSPKKRKRKSRKKKSKWNKLRIATAFIFGILFGLICNSVFLR